MALIETHISNGFLVGDRAYKLKKPIQTACLDYLIQALAFGRASARWS